MATRSLGTTKITIKLSSVVTNTLADSQAVTSPVEASIVGTITSGVQASQATRAWQWKNQTISSGGTQVIDLFDMGTIDIGAGAGLDAVGQSMALLEIAAIIIKNENAVTAAGELEIEPDASNGWTPIGSHTEESGGNGGALRGGGVLLKYQPSESGFLVVDASSHRLLLTAFGADCEFSIWLLGRHDVDDSSSSSSSSSTSSQSSSSSSTSSLSSSSSTSSLSSSSTS